MFLNSLLSRCSAATGTPRQSSPSSDSPLRFDSAPVEIAPVALNTIYHIVWDAMVAIAECKSLDYTSLYSPAVCADRPEAFRKRSCAQHC